MDDSGITTGRYEDFDDCMEKEKTVYIFHPYDFMPDFDRKDFSSAVYFNGKLIKVEKDF